MRALAHLFAIVAATSTLVSVAHAQAPDRGYGGPATVGPNFSTGKQSAPPDYGNGPPKQNSYAKPPVKKAAKPSKSDVKSARKPPSKPEPASQPGPANENTSATATPAAQTPGSTANGPAETKPVDGNAATPTVQTCRRFDATTGTTLEVACN